MYHLRFKGNKGFMCQYDKSLNFETIWSSTFDLDSLTIYRSEGNPRKCKYVKDERLKKLDIKKEHTIHPESYFK